MAVNFRLETKQAGKYVDLFQQTSLPAIVNGENILQIKTLSVTIPALPAFQLVQDVPVTTDAKMLNSLFEVFLVEDDKDSQKAYGTISQIEVVENTVKITRLQDFPEKEIHVNLVFLEAGVV